MTELQYKTVAVHVARHCLNHLRFVYEASFDFDGFTLWMRIRYNAARRFWVIRSDRFRVEDYRLTIQCGHPDIDFKPEKLLHYLN